MGPLEAGQSGSTSAKGGEGEAPLSGPDSVGKAVSEHGAPICEMTSAISSSAPSSPPEDPTAFTATNAEGGHLTVSPSQPQNYRISPSEPQGVVSAATAVPSDETASPASSGASLLPESLAGPPPLASSSSVSSSLLSPGEQPPISLSATGHGFECDCGELQLTAEEFGILQPFLLQRHWRLVPAPTRSSKSKSASKSGRSGGGTSSRSGARPSRRVAQELEALLQSAACDTSSPLQPRRAKRQNAKYLDEYETSGGAASGAAAGAVSGGDRRSLMASNSSRVSSRSAGLGVRGGCASPMDASAASVKSDDCSAVSVSTPRGGGGGGRSGSRARVSSSASSSLATGARKRRHPSSSSTLDDGYGAGSSSALGAGMHVDDGGSSDPWSEGAEGLSAAGGRPRRILASTRWRNSCMAILQHLKSQREAQWFLYPDNGSRDDPEYLSIVRLPMDLHTVEQRLLRGVYRHPFLWQQDVRQVFFNAFSYHVVKDDVWKDASILATEFENCCKNVDEVNAYAEIISDSDELASSLPPSQQPLAHATDLRVSGVGGAALSPCANAASLYSHHRAGTQQQQWYGGEESGSFAQAVGGAVSSLTRGHHGVASPQLSASGGSYSASSRPTRSSRLRSRNQRHLPHQGADVSAGEEEVFESPSAYYAGSVSASQLQPTAPPSAPSASAASRKMTSLSSVGGSSPRRGGASSSGRQRQSRGSGFLGPGGYGSGAGCLSSGGALSNASPQSENFAFFEAPADAPVPPPPPTPRIGVNDRPLSNSQRRVLEQHMQMLSVHQRRAALELVQDDLGILAADHMNDASFRFDTELLSIEKQKRLFAYVNAMVRANRELLLSREAAGGADMASSSSPAAVSQGAAAGGVGVGVGVGAPQTLSQGAFAGALHSKSRGGGLRSNSSSSSDSLSSSSSSDSLSSSSSSSDSDSDESADSRRQALPPQPHSEGPGPVSASTTTPARSLPQPNSSALSTSAPPHTSHSGAPSSQAALQAGATGPHGSLRANEASSGGAAAAVSRQPVAVDDATKLVESGGNVVVGVGGKGAGLVSSTNDADGAAAGLTSSVSAATQGASAEESRQERALPEYRPVAEDGEEVQIREELMGRHADFLGVIDAQQSEEACGDVRAGLKEMYRKHLLPLESDFKFHYFHSPLLTDGDFAAKPMVMVLGQYSTGKTSFVQHLLERDYPGLRIGPEPTTDKFVAIMEGASEQVIPGNTAVVDPTKPFSQLSNFGNVFLQRFECSMLPCVVLSVECLKVPQGLTLIDTPGVLSGNKQTTRGYDFESVVQWFAERVDLILLIFDAHKLDISDEFRRCIYALRGNDTKIRIVLNKADLVSYQQLMRIYGALMWSLGKVIATPEVARVYIGSFWNNPLQNDENRKLFEAEANDLYSDIARVPRDAAIRKLNDFIKRARLAKVHALLLNALRNKLPMFGREGKKKALIAGLNAVYEQVSIENGVPLGDFPPLALMKEKLASFDWSKIPKIDLKAVEALDNVIKTQIPQLMAMIPTDTGASVPSTVVDGSVVEGKVSPFLALSQSGGSVPSWAIDRYLHQPVDQSLYKQDFERIGPDATGRIDGAQAKVDLVKSKLPSGILHRVWNLADVTRDGYLDLYEYSLARRFIEMRLQGFELPATLPPNLLPPHMQPKEQSEIRHSFSGAGGWSRHPSEASPSPDVQSETQIQPQDSQEVLKPAGSLADISSHNAFA